MKLNLGNQIRANRRRMNLTQEQLAEKFGTSAQAVSRWENGTTYPDLEMLPMIASFFGTSVDAMLGCSDEEKKKFCSELQKELENAVRARNSDEATKLMREIRRNLREYQDYWFWGMYHEIWKTRLFRDKKVLDEMRLLAEEIFSVCPRQEHYDVIGCMANMEDDDHIDAFLDAHACREDMGRTNLLFRRYKMREELDKIEPVRQFILWNELSHIISAANDWQEYLCEDAAHWKWYSEIQLNFINALNCLSPDKRHLVSGETAVDLWCTERMHLGMRYSVALAKLGETDAAFDIFEDTVSLLERIIAIEDDEFDLGCTSPSLKGFSLKSKFHWLDEGDGTEHRQLCMECNNLNNWIIPIHYLNATNDPWFDSMKPDERFVPLLDRLKKCVVKREISDK